MHHRGGGSIQLHQLYPNSKYLTHCRNRALNLSLLLFAITSPVFHNFMDEFKELDIFFHYSEKDKHVLLDYLMFSNKLEDFLAKCIEDEFLPKRKFQGLPVLSDTHWLTQVYSINCLLQNYRGFVRRLKQLKTAQLVRVQAMSILSSNGFYHLRFWCLPLSVSMFLFTQGLSQWFCKQKSAIFTKHTKWLRGL